MVATKVDSEIIEFLKEPYVKAITVTVVMRLSMPCANSIYLLFMHTVVIPSTQSSVGGIQETCIELAVQPTTRTLDGVVAIDAVCSVMLSHFDVMMNV